MLRKWRYLSLIVLLVIGNVAFYTVKHPTKEIEPLIDKDAIPFHLGNWHGEKRTMEKGRCINKKAEVILCREYKNRQSDSVWLVLVYSRNRRALNLPERLYQAYGYNILKEEKLFFNEKQKAKRLIVEKNEKREMVLYLLTDSERTTHNLLVQQFFQSYYRLTGKDKGWALVRVFATINEDYEKVNEKLCSFLGLLISEIHRGDI